MDSILLVGAGGAGVIGLYLLYVGATKGVPAVYATVKAWWNAAKNDLASVKGDVATLQQKYDTAIAGLRSDVDAAKAEIATLKTKVPA